MAQTVTRAALRFTLTADESELVTLPSWARGVGVYVESVASVRVAPGADAGAVEGADSPTAYVTVGIGSIYTREHTGGGFWVHSTGAAVVVVEAYESVP